MVCFHMTSRRPCWWVRTMKWSCWLFGLVLWEFSFFCYWEMFHCFSNYARLVITCVKTLYCSESHYDHQRCRVLAFDRSELGRINFAWRLWTNRWIQREISGVNILLFYSKTLDVLQIMLAVLFTQDMQKLCQDNRENYSQLVLRQVVNNFHMSLRMIL